METSFVYIKVFIITILNNLKVICVFDVFDIPHNISNIDNTITSLIRNIFNFR